MAGNVALCRDLTLSTPPIYKKNVYYKHTVPGI